MRRIFPDQPHKLHDLEDYSTKLKELRIEPDPNPGIRDYILLFNERIIFRCSKNGRRLIHQVRDVVSAALEEVEGDFTYRQGWDLPYGRTRPPGRHYHLDDRIPHYLEIKCEGRMEPTEQELQQEKLRAVTRQERLRKNLPQAIQYDPDDLVEI